MSYKVFGGHYEIQLTTDTKTHSLQFSSFSCIYQTMAAATSSEMCSYPYTAVGKFNVGVDVFVSQFSDWKCTRIDQKLLWKDLGPVFFKNNCYVNVVDQLLNSHGQFYNVLTFCEENPNCIEIEIVLNKGSNSWYSGHHIFASCPLDLKLLLENPVSIEPLTIKDVKVKYIHNYLPVEQVAVKKFLEMVEGLKAIPLQPEWGQTQCRINIGSFFKRVVNVPVKDSYEDHKHLAFLMDLRRYCRNYKYDQVSRPLIKTEQDLIEYVNQFHKDHVELDNQPRQHEAWALLRVLMDRKRDCQFISDSLNWDNVKDWILPNQNLRKTVKTFKKVNPEFEFQPPTNDFMEPELIDMAVEQFKKFNKKSLVRQMVGKMKAINPSFDVRIDRVSDARQHEYVTKNYLAHYTPAQKKKDLTTKMESTFAEDRVVFSVYEELFKTTIMQGLKNPEAKAIKSLEFLFQTIQINGIIGLISVPDCSGITAELVIVVNNVQKNAQSDLIDQLLNFMRGKNLPKMLLNCLFSIFYGGVQFIDLNFVQAFNEFEKLFKGVQRSKIDGSFVCENSITLKSWSASVTSAIKFLAFSRMFLTRLLDDDVQDTAEKGTDVPIKDLIQQTDQNLTKLLMEKCEHWQAAFTQSTAPLSLFLTKLSTKMEWLLFNLPEGTEVHLQSITKLNKLLACLIEAS